MCTAVFLVRIEKVAAEKFSYKNQCIKLLSQDFTTENKQRRSQDFPCEGRGRGHSILASNGDDLF